MSRNSTSVRCASKQHRWMAVATSLLPHTSRLTSSRRLRRPSSAFMYSTLRLSLSSTPIRNVVRMLISRMAPPYPRQCRHTDMYGTA